jgi:hypothetical protein
MSGAESFFDLKDDPFRPLFDNTEYAGDCLKNIKINQNQKLMERRYYHGKTIRN